MNSNNPRLARSVVPLFIGLTALALAVAGCGKHPSNAPASLVPLTLEAGGSAAASVVGLKAAGLAPAGSSTAQVEVMFTRALLVVRDVRFMVGELLRRRNDNH